MNVPHRPGAHFIETPRGIFTSAGNWFHITSEALEKFAPGLLEVRSLEKLIKKSEVWIRSTDNLGIVVFMLFLFGQELWLAIAATCFFVPVWHINKAGLMSIWLTAILNILDKEIIIILLSVFVLSWMGIIEQYATVFFGIIFFCVLKFGWFRGTVEWVFGKINKGSLLLNDRILKMLIIKYAMKENIPVGETEAMEKEILSLVNKQKEVWTKYKKGNKKL